MEHFSFKSSNIPCNAKDFNFDNKCKRKYKSKNCFSEVTSVASAEDPETRVVDSFTVLNYRGGKQKIKEPKCRKFDLEPLTQEDQLKCGFFCFIHQLDQVFLDEGNFSCKYIAPDYQRFNKEMKLLSGINSESISFWEETIKVVTVEIFCAKKNKASEEKTGQKREEFSGNDEKDKLLKEKLDYSKTETEIEELRQKLESQKQELEDSNTNNEKLNTMLEVEKEQNDLLKKDMEMQKEKQLKDENLFIEKINENQKEMKKTKKREQIVKRQLVKEIKKRQI